jgi:hypothetical protein
MQVDVSSRLRKLRDEVSRVKTNERLEEAEKVRIIGEKYAVIMKPPVVQLERLLATTSVPPQTPHEASFQKTFLQRTSHPALYPAIACLTSTIRSLSFFPLSFSADQGS